MTDTKVPEVGMEVWFHSNLPVYEHRGLKLSGRVLEVGGRDGLTITVETHLPMATNHYANGSTEPLYLNNSVDVVPGLRPLAERPSPQTDKRGNPMPEPVAYSERRDQSNGYWSFKE
jgi:hypothetical protein